MAKERDISLDVAKAMLIMLMVLGHSLPRLCQFNTFVSYFNMPCFFFISGMLLKERYVTTNIKEGIVRKIKAYYVTYVKWGLFFVLMHNVFALLHFFHHSYSLKEILNGCFCVVIMSKRDDLFLQGWFLSSLFWASIFSTLLICVLKKHKIYSKTNIVLAISVLLVLAFFDFVPNISQFSVQTVLALTFFLSGWLSKEFINKYSAFLEKYFWWLFLVPFIASFEEQKLIISVKGLDAILYYVIAIIGTFAFIGFSKWIAKYNTITPLLNYIGNRTLYILIFHILFMRFVSLTLYYCYDDIPIYELTKFYIIEGYRLWFAIPYTIVGIGGSLLMWKLLHLNSK